MYIKVKFNIIAQSNKNVHQVVFCSIELCAGRIQNMDWVHRGCPWTIDHPCFSKHLAMAEGELTTHAF